MRFEVGAVDRGRNSCAPVPQIARQGFVLSSHRFGSADHQGHSEQGGQSRHRIAQAGELLFMVITTTLIRTNRVPRTVRRSNASPPRKYPSSTATTGFTYAYVPTLVGDSR